MMEVRRNYDAVNAAIVNEQHKAYEALRIQRASKWALYGTALIRLCCAAAIIILALAFGWWLLSDHRDTIYNTTFTSIDAETRTAIEKLADSSQIQVVEGGKVETEFTVFHSVDHDEFSINTGWNYKPDNLSHPYYQYCYWTSSSRNFKSGRVDLGASNSAGEISWHPVENKYAQYSDNCQFKTNF